MKTILAICGSTRQASSNLSLIQAIAELYPNELRINIFPSVADLPHFNPDLDIDEPPLAVKKFRKQIHNADAVLISTPEYAMGLPGSLKNALDWTVKTADFSAKPVAAITASSSGKKAHQSLIDVLTVIEAKMTVETQLLISFIKTKVRGREITDPATLQSVQVLVASLMKLMEADILPQE